MTTNTHPTWAALKARELREHPEVFAAYRAFTAAALRGEHPDPDRPLILVERPEDVPSFPSEDEEHEYWGTHDMGDAFEGASLPSDAQDALARIRKRRSNGAE